MMCFESTIYSSEDRVSCALHLSLEHLEEQNDHVQKLTSVLCLLQQSPGTWWANWAHWVPRMCNWILDFLTYRPQSLCVGRKHPMTHNCCARFDTNIIISNNADSTTMVGPIRDKEELGYREEVKFVTSTILTWMSIKQLRSMSTSRGSSPTILLYTWTVLLWRLSRATRPCGQWPDLVLAHICSDQESLPVAPVPATAEISLGDHVLLMFRVICTCYFSFVKRTQRCSSLCAVGAEWRVTGTLDKPEPVCQ